MPARFQAATDKAIKFKLHQVELAGKTKALQEQAEAAAKTFHEKLEAVAKEAAENEAKLIEADQELAAVKADLAAEQPGQAQRSPEATAVGICQLLQTKAPGMVLDQGFWIELARLLGFAGAAAGTAEAALGGAAAAGQGPPPAGTVAAADTGMWAASQAAAEAAGQALCAQAAAAQAAAAQ